MLLVTGWFKCSVHSQTWPVIVTVTKRALLSSSLPVPRSTADENSNHNHFIIKEDSFTVQLTFSDGNCSSSIYPLAFHRCFVSKTLSFVYKVHAYMFVEHIVFYDIWSLKVSKTTEILTGSPIDPNRTFLFHHPPRVSHRPLWEPLNYTLLTLL